MSPCSLLPTNDAQSLRLTEAAQLSASGIVSRTVLQSPELRVVLFTFAEGQELTSHTSRRRALVQVVEGAGEFLFNGKWQRLDAGTLLHLPPNHPHAVKASAGAFSMLLTLGADAPERETTREQAVASPLVPCPRTSAHSFNDQPTMNHVSDILDDSRLDVREIPCRSKHPRIFQRWTDLPVGGFFVLVNDHDPVPLYYQFAAQYSGAFTWEYLVAGPDEFQVKITRIAETPHAIVPPLPGSCGGGTPAPAKTAASANGEKLDVRGLQPPEPMRRILEAVESLAPGGTLRAHLERRPIYLYPELDSRDIRHTSEEQTDGSWIVTLARA